MYGLGSNFPPGILPPSSQPSDTLGVAASQAASLNWWGMASQLATQDYLSRLQQQPPPLQSKPKPRNAEEVVVSSEGLRLPRVRIFHDYVSRLRVTAVAATTRSFLETCSQKASKAAK